ncbi:MAG: DnaJ related protein [Oscillospiraceae bacterium]|jgi:predicted Zn-dependent protease|nr:DnaJ related protein [Oscillospiraceae bacterium]
MNDPYRVLGVSPNATDEQIRDAYRELSKKYHPDLHSQSPLADLAEEKMKEINAAYDEIMNMRRGGQNSGGYSYNQYNQGGYSQSQYYGDFAEIRRQIQNGNYTVADSMLDNPSVPRNAEWSFLKGSVCYARGWLNEAFTHFTNAVNQDPGNAEYRAAYNQMMQARNGNMNGSPYRYYGSPGGCSTCDMCQGLICADCCCECFGGDLIECC